MAWSSLEKPGPAFVCFYFCWRYSPMPLSCGGQSPDGKRLGPPSHLLIVNKLLSLSLSRVSLMASRYIWPRLLTRGVFLGDTNLAWAK